MSTSAWSASFLIKVTEFFRDPELFACCANRCCPSSSRQRAPAAQPAAPLVGGLRHGRGGVFAGDPGGGGARRGAGAVHVRIFATDARCARPSRSPAVASIPPRRWPRCLGRCIARYFTRHDDVRGQEAGTQPDDLRRARPGAAAPFPQIDLVLCRNVLIYFTPELPAAGAAALRVLRCATAAIWRSAKRSPPGRSRSSSKPRSGISRSSAVMADRDPPPRPAASVRAHAARGAPTPGSRSPPGGEWES